MALEHVDDIKMLSKSECERLFESEIYNEFCMMNPLSKLFDIDGNLFHFKLAVEWEEVITGWWIFKRKTSKVKSVGPIYINTETGYAFTTDEYYKLKPNTKSIFDKHIKDVDIPEE